MKKITGFIMLVLFFCMPIQIYADKLDSDDSQNENYNEYGIIKGTEVYGEDISELTQEELQYVPKGWRDGVVEGEHVQEKNNRLLMRAIYPSVNNYIENIVVPKVEYDYKDFFTKFNYRNGYGKVEGVVAHETANDNSTIESEISYMSKNHLNAFVHAFIDHNRIIEIHPLEYGAWGAGRYANQRFVHVELVRVNTFDQFARSINNYANYIANIQYKYNLGITDAESSGKGSLWSHKAVSVHLGGTTHVDPHGYFSRYGYNWSQFVSLVTEKHNKLITQKVANTSKLGHIKSTDVKIYNNPIDQQNYSKAGSKNTNEVFYIKSQARVKNANYYLLSREPSSKQGTIGWVEAKDISSHVHKGVDKDAKKMVINGNGNAYNKAWGGANNFVYDLSDFVGEEFRIHLTEKVGNNTWYRGILKGKTVWIHSSYVSKIVVNNTSKLGHIRNSDGVILNDIYNKSDSFKAGSININKVYYIKKQANIEGDLYYLISNEPSTLKGKVGWVKAKDLKVHEHNGIDKEKKTYTIQGKGKAYEKAWGGPKDLVYNLSDFSGETFNVHLTESVGSNVWYRGTLKEKTVWIHSSYLIDENNTSKLGHIINGNVNIYLNLYDNLNSFKAGKEYTNLVYYIKKQANVKGQMYYLISTQPRYGVVGWVKAEDLSTHKHVGADKNKKTFYIKGNGTAYSKAWGGSKDVLYGDLSPYINEKFNVNLTEKVGNNIWYRGIFKGKTIWLHSSYVTTKKESVTSKLGHIRNEKVKIYKELGEISTAIEASDKLTNTVYFIKKQAKLNGQIYYLISTRPSSNIGTIGWVKETDMSIHSHHGIDKTTKTFYFKGTGRAYSKAWGGAKELVYEDMSIYTHERFDVHLTEKIGNNIWYRGNFKGKTIWLHSSYLTKKVESSISRLGHIRNSEVKIYNTLGDNASNTAGKDHINKVYYIKKQATLGEHTFYLVSREPSITNGVLGWVNANDLLTHTHVGLDKKKKTFILKGIGSSYSKAWGGSKDEVFQDLEPYKGVKFNVHLTEKVGNNTWYRGELNGKRIWLHSSYLK
ncbi:N-acetylmuramoyl-L-alanine amidase family protein [Oceanobacillus jordanicus]|uniref:Autolysin n=1 Tax=Oceanobacillus jordanicus TaxID=2867266 RepID=A0AAW5B368_9BACI|nr:GW dipeptide domain-containing protein [Oceanobacillus jordanicus]MCG3418019.1 GW dipeptide domain-containing protein [Oceanobacillus jordanicus]